MSLHLMRMGLLKPGGAPPPPSFAIVQSNKGVSTLATTTASFSSSPTNGNLIVLVFASDDYNGTPDAGWTQSSQMEQQGWHGSYLWWRVHSGGGNSFQYTLPSAANSSWVIVEVSGQHASPYDVSAGQITNTGGGIYTTPSITPTAGDRLLIGAFNGSSDTGNLNTNTTDWLNSFTHILSSGPASGTGTYDFVSVGYRFVTANGSTSYSTGATKTGDGLQSRSGLIISFKKA